MNTDNWKYFKVGDLFEVDTCESLIETSEGEFPYITRTSFNNGVKSFVDLYDVRKGEEYILNKGNCITVGAEGLFAFYQPQDFVAGVKIYTVRNKKLNKYNALFITTLLNLEVYKYCYGRARIKERIENEIIKLPVDTTGNPDWEYMENYIKSLPYGDLL